MVELARVCGGFDGTSLEFIPAVGRFSAEHVDLITRMSAAANRPLNWNLIAPSHQPQADGGHGEQPRRLRLRPAAGRQDHRPHRALRHREPAELRDAASCSTPSTAGGSRWRCPSRRRWRCWPTPRSAARSTSWPRAPARMRGVAKWHVLTVGEVVAEENQQYVGPHDRRDRRGRGRGPPSTCCATSSSPTSSAPASTSPLRGDDDETWKLRVEVWRDERTVLGGTDAGAHLDLLATFNATSAMLGSAVRQRDLLSWEEAVHHITDVPAQLYGIKERGRLAEGWQADVVRDRPRPRSAPGPPTPATTCPAAPGGSTARPTASTTCSSTARRSSADGEFTDARPGRPAALGAGHQRHRRRLARDRGESMGGVRRR